MMWDKIEIFLILLLVSIVIAFILCIFIAGVLIASDIIGDLILNLMNII